jgi:alanine-synthesizing transaminase
MFSSRFLPALPEENPLWSALQSLRNSGANVIDLTISNPTLAGLPYPSAIPSLLASGVFPYRPSPQGDEAARRAISAYHHGRGEDRAPEDLILTASTSEAYAYLFKLLCDPGDEVLIPSPTYPLFDALAELEHVKLVRYPLRLREEAHASRWEADFAFLRSVISTRCKALILVHPNNPTGHLADAREISAYLDLAAEYGLALIVDGVFSDYVLDGRPCPPIVSEGPLVFSLNGLSKCLALPQLKLGWIHVGGAPSAVAAAKAHLEWIVDAFLSVNTPVQAACPALLGLREQIQAPILARLRANLAAARKLAAASSRVRALIPEAGWSVIVRVAEGGDDEAFCLTLLREKLVHAHPGHLFGLQDGCHAVLSLLTPENDFESGLMRLIAHAEARP